jgi:hypothetical protein
MGVEATKSMTVEATAMPAISAVRSDRLPTPGARRQCCAHSTMAPPADNRAGTAAFSFGNDCGPSAVMMVKTPVSSS